MVQQLKFINDKYFNINYLFTSFLFSSSFSLQLTRMDQAHKSPTTSYIQEDSHRSFYLTWLYFYLMSMFSYGMDLNEIRIWHEIIWNTHKPIEKSG